MNLPKSQKTGRLAELAVDEAFTSWGWNVGQDHIDIGYDLCVTPDYDTYKGVRFLVQVKGTASLSEKIPNAPVFRSRLRQYAADVLPVFILRVAADSTIYWIHAQAWAKKNLDTLRGNGKGRVSFDPSQKLADRAAFEQYLKAVCKTLFFTKDRLSVVPEGHPFPFTEYRSSTTQFSQNQKSIEQAPAALLSFRPVGTPENIAQLRDAFEYGFPRTFDVDSMNIEPPVEIPDLFKPLDLSRGKLTMKRLSSMAGHVLICSGREYSVLSKELKVPVDLFTGAKGIGISNELRSSPLGLTLRISQDGARLKANLDFSIRAKCMHGKPLHQFHDLAPLAGWAEQVAAEDAMLLALDFDDIQEELKTTIDSLSNLLPMLQKIRSLSRLHMVARALKSEFSLSESDFFSIENFQDIDFAYELLRGARRAVSLDPMKVSPASREARDRIKSPGAFRCQTQWLLEVAGRSIGEIPVEIDLTGYVAADIPGTEEILISKGEDAQAWVMHKKHTEERGYIRRQGPNSEASQRAS